MSIFTKTCPRCAADNAADVPRCLCGYVFDGNVTSDSYAAIEVALQEAELYAEYLKARLHQTREAADVAAADAERYPDDSGKVDRAEVTRAEYKSTKAEYKVQIDQISCLRADAEIRKKRETAAAQRNAWELARKRVADRAAAPAPTAAAMAAGKRKHGAQKRPPEPVRPPATMQEKLAREAHQAIARTRDSRTPPTVPGRHRTDPPSSQESATAKSTKEPAKRTARVQQARATPAAPEKLRPATIECPHCTAILPIGSKRCRCGFSFTKTPDVMPTIGLTREEQARLLSLFQEKK